VAIEGTLEITISNQVALSKIPDSRDFTLRDVCDVIVPSTKSLRNCFITAGATLFASGHISGFDSRYEGDHDRLSNFRNYPIEETLLGYGLLYNWFAVNTGILAPTGWHVPTETELNVLIDYLGGWEVAGGKLKEIGLTHWESPNANATDDYGFKGIGAGSRSYYQGIFYDARYFCGCWLVTENPNNPGTSESLVMYYDNANSSYGQNTGYMQNDGHSVRFIKDNSTPADCIDYDTNNYGYITIGTQIWSGANFKGVHYNNGTDISEVADGTAWAALTTGALCAYDNDWNNV
jgi:uncharacterized protein (TIGR02145 family)